MTTDGVTRPLERPFLVLATQNPIEYEGTYPLPEAQLDRFLLRTGFGYPSEGAEWEMLARRIERREDDLTLTQVIDRQTLLAMQAAVELVHVDPSVGRYIVALVAATRESTSLAVGASPRGSLALLKLSRCRAALAGRDFVTPDDVKAIAVPALAHRLLLKPELWVQRRSGEDVVRDTLEQVPTPPAEDVGTSDGVTPYASPRLVPYLGLAALGLIAALALRRPELVVVAAPFALIVAAGLLFEGRPEVKAWLTIERERTLEGEEIVAEIELNATGAVDLLELHLVIPHGLTVVDGDNPCSIRLGADEERTISLTLRCDRWGAVELGDIYLRARGRIGMLAWEGRVRRPHRIQIYPRPELLQSLVAPLDTQLATGDLVARVRADGLEFADTRQFVPGDRLRSVNWRASARRGELIVNERHPDRNADVVLFLDSFAEARSDDEADGTLELAVRAAATLAGRYLERRDRVGLVTFGGILRWLEPGGGLVQRYRLIDALLETGVEFSYAWKDVNIIPARTLPPKALVIAVTPLLDERSIAALHDLRARGHDLAIVEVSPEELVEPGDGLDALAYRLWLLRRAALRARFERSGVAVARWRDELPLDAGLEGVRAFRRRARLSQR